MGSLWSRHQCRHVCIDYFQIHTACCRTFWPFSSDDFKGFGTDWSDWRSPLLQKRFLFVCSCSCCVCKRTFRDRDGKADDCVQPFCTKQPVHRKTLSVCRRKPLGNISPGIYRKAQVSVGKAWKNNRIKGRFFNCFWSVLELHDRGLCACSRLYKLCVNSHIDLTKDTWYYDTGIAIFCGIEVILCGYVFPGSQRIGLHENKTEQYPIF